MFYFLRPFLGAIAFFGAVAALVPQPSFAAKVASYVKECETILTKYGDAYTSKDELEHFWEIHPRFGIIYRNDRFILITKSEEFNRQLQEELSVWTESLNEPIGAVARVEVPEVKDAIAYDITELMPTIAKTYHGRFGYANCWSFACFNAKISYAITNMKEREFSLWLSSPLLRKLDASEEIRPGDMIAYRAASQEVHGAIYVSDNLTFSKNGAGTGIFRLQDSHEVTWIYHHKFKRELRQYIYVTIYRLEKTWHQFLGENRHLITHDMQVALDALHGAEALSVKKNIAPREYPFELEGFQKAAIDSLWRSPLPEIKKARALIDEKANEAHAANRNNKSRTNEDEERMRLWRAIWYRSFSLY